MHYAIVGAVRDDHNGSASGSAYIFERSGTTWSQQAKITATDGALADQFGVSVAIDGDHAIAGAPGDDDNFPNSGSAYVFRCAGATWTEQAKLTANDGASGDSFGNSVAIDGGHVIVGANNAFTFSSGSAYVFELVAFPAAILASDGDFTDRVQIKWQDHSALEDGFRIYRDGKLIETVAANFQSYSDFEAQPGRTYEYAFAAFREELGESSRLADFGWRPPDGNITGRIATRAGTGTDSISVCLDPAPNQALLFDGIGGHIAIADDNTFDFTSSDDFTIEAWIKYSHVSGQFIIEKWSNTGGFPFLLTTGPRGTLQFLMSDDVNFPRVLTSRSNLNDIAWHHVACVHEAATKELRIYVDGTFDGSTTYTSLGTIANSSALYFGRAGTTASEVFGRQLDEVRIVCSTFVFFKT